MNLEQARENMIKQQVRTWHVTDDRVAALLNKYPRDQFVPDAWRELAYADMAIPLADGGRMLTPSMEARILQSLQVQRGERVLEITTGCGYLTAILADLSGDVVTLDSSDKVEPSIRDHLENVRFEQGDIRNGWQDLGQFDVIVLTGSLRQLPEGLSDRLTPGGRIFAVLGDDPVMQAMLLTRREDGGMDRQVLFDTSVPRLTNAAEAPAFTF